MCAWVLAPDRVEGGHAASTFKSRFLLLIVKFVLRTEGKAYRMKLNSVALVVVGDWTS